MKKGGFTLVELLAVIAVLAILAILAFAAVGPMIEKAGKQSLGLEGVELMKAAEQAIVEDEFNITKTVSDGNPVCFTMEYLCNQDYYPKGCSGEESYELDGVKNYKASTAGDGYAGSVLVQYDKTNNQYIYQFWISNGKYKFGHVINSGNKSTYSVHIEGSNINNYMIIGGITKETYKNIDGKDANGYTIAESSKSVGYTTCGFGSGSVTNNGHLYGELKLNSINSTEGTVYTRITYCAKRCNSDKTICNYSCKVPTLNPTTNPTLLPIFSTTEAYHN